MVDESFYQDLLKNYQEARNALEDTKEIIEFSKTAGIALRITDAEVKELESRVLKLGEALKMKGYVI